MAGPEIAFAGRSNVGKSSLINALTGRHALARTSNTPGQQELVFFGSSVPLVLVDLPGYGYAAAAKTKVAAWTRLIHDYLRGRAALARVYVLIDARHGLKTTDEAILDTLSQAAVSHRSCSRNATRSAMRRWPRASRHEGGPAEAAGGVSAGAGSFGAHRRGHRRIPRGDRAPDPRAGRDRRTRGPRSIGRARTGLTAGPIQSFRPLAETAKTHRRFLPPAAGPIAA